MTVGHDQGGKCLRAGRLLTLLAAITVFAAVVTVATMAHNCATSQ